MNGDRKDLSDIVEFIVDHSFRIIQWRLLAAMNLNDELPDDYFKYDQDKLSEILEMAKPMISAAQQSKKIEAETSKSIVGAVASGKLTIDEAIKMMAMTKIKLEVEDKEMTSAMKKKMLGLLNEGSDDTI